jgi:hypothetical protein
MTNEPVQPMDGTPAPEPSPKSPKLISVKSSRRTGRTERNPRARVPRRENNEAG